MSSWTHDPDRVIAAELIDEAHDYDREARTAPLKDVEWLRDAAAKCRRLAWEITNGKRNGASALLSMP